MIKIILYDDNFIISKQDLQIKSLEKLLSIDCLMKIIIKDKNFYDDVVCPLELYNQFKTWYNNINIGTIYSFNYNTEDNDENPIFSIKYNSLDNMWTLHSIFENYTETNKFTTEDVKEIFIIFEKELFKHLKYE